jgi:hypothetical protein
MPKPTSNVLGEPCQSRRVRFQDKAMKTLFTFMLLCVSVLATDDIAVTTTVKPHSSRPGQATTREVFTRGGQTNLVRVTTSRDGRVISRLHRFYYNRTLVADHMQLLLEPVDGSDLTTTSGFSLALRFATNNQILEAYVGDRKGKILDAFTSTNGTLVPVPTADLKMIKKSMATRGEE